MRAADNATASRGLRVGALYVLLCLLAVLVGWAEAQTVYRCTGADGQVEFRQRPCAQGQQGGEVQVRPINSVEAPRMSDDLQRTLRARSAIGRGEIVAGMTVSEVHEVLGLPQAVNSTSATWGTRDQLVYRNADGSTRYVYLRDGLVDAVSTVAAGGRRMPSEPCYSAQDIRNARVGAESNVLPPEERQRRRLTAEEMARCRR